MMEFNTDSLDEYCRNTFGHSNWEFIETKPDHVLILPWNLKAEITTAHAYVRDWDGDFVIAVPELTVLP